MHEAAGSMHVLLANLESVAIGGSCFWSTLHVVTLYCRALELTQRYSALEFERLSLFSQGQLLPQGGTSFWPQPVHWVIASFPTSKRVGV